jgi:predicted dehydrogenase
VGVVGVGYFGSLHAEKYAEIPGVELSAICDINRQTAETISARHGAKAELDYRSLYGQIDAASVAVPTELHFSIARDLLEHGIHVLLEKPICRTLEEADVLIELAAAKGLVLQIGHLERFGPAVQGLHGVLNRPRYIECRRISPFRERGMDTNVVLDLMIHDIDLIFDIVTAPVKSIEAIGVPVLSDVEDIAYAHIRFADGCIASITASRVSWKTERTMRIFQTDGYLVLDLDQNKLSVIRRVADQADGSSPRLTTEQHDYEPSDNLKREINSFLTAIEDGTPPPVNASDARRALEAALIIGDQLQFWRDDGD